MGESETVFLRFIDLGRCMGCETCQYVCEFVNSRPLIKVYRTSLGLEIPLSCFHCRNAPCVQACPTGAMRVDEQGAVRVEKFRCIGCLSCLYACPFGIPELDPEAKIVTKCDLCSELRTRGLEPACYVMCPAGAIMYGEPLAVFDKVKRRVAEDFARSRFRASEISTTLQGQGL